MHISFFSWIFALFALSLSGCMTQIAPLPSPSPITAIVSQTAPILGVASVKDNRQEQEVGMVGALSIAVGNDLVSYTDTVLKQHLAQLGFRVVSAPDPIALKGVNLEYVFNGKVVLVTIQDVSFGAIDALLDTGDAAITLHALVFDRNGQEIYSASHVGEHSEWIGFSFMGKTEGRIIAAAVDDAIKKLTENQSFRDAIR